MGAWKSLSKKTSIARALLEKLLVSMYTTYKYTRRTYNIIDTYTEMGAY